MNDPSAAIPHPALSAMPPEAATLYSPDDWAKASGLVAREFRQILIWPLAMKMPDGSQQAGENAESATISQRVHGLAREIDTGIDNWERIPNPLKHCPPCANEENDNPDPYSYSEFVYFHDFIQRILYRPQPDGEMPDAPDHGRAYYLFRRQDVRFVYVEMDFDGDKLCFRMDVERCYLYLFASGVAQLVIEVSACGSGSVTDQPKQGEEFQRDLTLADIQNFTDLFRRAYTPYFSKNNGAYSPSQCPVRVSWLNEARACTMKEKDRCPPSLKEDSRFISSEETERTAPVYPHWRWLLPLNIAGYPEDGEKAGAGIFWRHIVDERIPTLSWISLTGASGGYGAVKDVMSVSRGDWMRLCFADPAGDDVLPYNSYFLKEFEQSHCYDRFFPSAASSTSATRHVFSGYNYATVGAGLFFDTHIKQHFRRHYFLMGLLAHLEFASLITYSSRISQAVTAYSDSDHYRRLENDILHIQEDYLRFTHGFRFSGVSNQIQGQEMYAMWRKHLRLDEIGRDLSDELNNATGYLHSSDQSRQARAGTMLNVIAIIGMIIGLALSGLGVSVFLRQGGVFSRQCDFWCDLTITGGLFTVTSILGLAFLRYFLPPKAHPGNGAMMEKLHVTVGYLFGGSLVVFFIALMTMLGKLD